MPTLAHAKNHFEFALCIYQPNVWCARVISQRISSFFLGLVIASTLILALFTWPSSQVEGLSDWVLRKWHIPTLLAEVLFVASILFSPAYARQLSKLSPIQWGLGISLFTFVAWRSFSSELQFSRLYGVGWLIHILFFYSLILKLSKDPKEVLNPIWKLMILVAAVQVFLYWSDLLFELEEGIKRKTPVFSHFRHLPFLLAPVLGVASYAYLRRKSEGAFYLIGFTASWFYMFVTGARGGVVAGLLAIGLAIFFVFRTRTQISTRQLLVLLGCTFIALLLSEISPTSHRTLLDRDIVGNTGSVDSMSSGRLKLWKLYADYWTINQWFGHGPTALSMHEEFSKYSWITQPHSLIFQVLLHWGLIGTGLLLATLASFHKALQTGLRPADNYFIPVLVVLSMLLHSLVDGGLFYPFSVAIFLTAMAAIIGLGLNASEEIAS